MELLSCKIHGAGRPFFNKTLPSLKKTQSLHFMLVKNKKERKKKIFKEWIWCDFVPALPAALYWTDTWTFPQGNVAVRGTSLWWEEARTGVFCLAGIEELHFSPLQHLQPLGCSVTFRDTMHGAGGLQSRSAPSITAQVIAQFPLHLSFCFLLASAYCPALISTSSVTKIRLFSLDCS